MTFRVICVGKLKERYFADACAEYLKRLGRYADTAVWEVPDEKAPEVLSPAQQALVKRAEGARLLARIAPGDYVAALDKDGAQMDSAELAAFLQARMNEGKSRMDFLIGGSLGLSPEVLARADVKLSFGKNTFPHQLFRVMLLEQLYRACKINANEPYHK